jgi:hypothetical protein
VFHKRIFTSSEIRQSAECYHIVSHCVVKVKEREVDRQLLHSYFMSLVVNLCSKRAAVGSIQQDYKPRSGRA